MLVSPQPTNSRAKLISKYQISIVSHLLSRQHFRSPLFPFSEIDYQTAKSKFRPWRRGGGSCLAYSSDSEALEWWYTRCKTDLWRNLGQHFSNALQRILGGTANTIHFGLLQHIFGDVQVISGQESSNLTSQISGISRMLRVSVISKMF